MNISELNLDVNTYTDARLQKNFGLADNYTKEDVIAATNRLASVASSTLGPNDEEAFNAFLRAAEERLLKRKMVESSSPAWTDQHSYLNSNELLPSDRELTIIPEQKTQINTLSQGTGVLATVSHTLPLTSNIKRQLYHHSHNHRHNHSQSQYRTTSNQQCDKQYDDSATRGSTASRGALAAKQSEKYYFTNRFD